MRWLGFISLVVIALMTTTSAEEIDSCGVIDSPGYYVLTSDIIDSSETHCIEIESSNVILDGNGHKIDGDDKWSSHGIYIYGPLSFYTNITIKNVVLSDWEHGIYLRKVNKSKIVNIVAFSNRFGVSMYSTDNITISGNNITGNSDKGINMQSSSNNRIVNNNVSLNKYGIYIQNSDNNTVAKNNASSCSTGINLYYSDRNCVKNNTANYCQYGMWISHSNENYMLNNDARVCGQHGFYFTYSNNNTLANSTVSYAQYGIYISYSEGNRIANNDIQHNTNGIYLYSSTNNKIYFNNFIYNDNNAYQNKENLWNSPQPITYTYNGQTFTNYVGNYWSDYTGSDNDGDGIGDTPYNNLDYYPLISTSENYGVKFEDIVPPIPELPTLLLACIALVLVRTRIL